MLYLVVQMGAILAVAALVFFALGYWLAAGRAQPSAEVPEPVPDPQVERELAEARGRIGDFERQVADLEADLERAREHIAGDEAGDSEPGAPVAAGAEDSEIGLVYAVRPEAVDDLTKIRGVGKVIARQLNDLGIYTLEQIAAWDKAQVDAASGKLAFKDRIRRDDWVAQAKRLLR